MSQATVTWLEPDVLLLAGEISYATVAATRSEGEALMERAPSSFLVDLQGLSSAHSITLSLLIRWVAHARRQNKQFRIRNMPRKLFDVARVSGLEAVLPLLEPEQPAA